LTKHKLGFRVPFDFGDGQRNARAFAILAKTKLGTTREQVSAALANLARQNEQDFAGTNPEYAGRGIYLQPLAEFYFGPVRKALLILMGAVALVLLIACANIANLLLAKSMGRSQEIAIRTAMGASRARIIRQMLIESAVLGLLGGGLGLLIASWGTRGLMKLIPAGIIPPDLNITMNVQVLLFTLGVSLITAFIFGLWPAIQGSRAHTREALQAASQRATAGVAARRAQSALVVAEVALSLILLVMAGLMIRSFAKTDEHRSGNEHGERDVDAHQSIAGQVERRRTECDLFQSVIDRVKTLPGIEAAGVASHMPFVFTEDWPITVESVANAGVQTQSIDTRTVSSEYFTTMQIPLVVDSSFRLRMVHRHRGRHGEPGDGQPLLVQSGSARGRESRLATLTAKSPWFAVKVWSKTQPRHHSIATSGLKSIFHWDKWPDAIAA
jgi:putative ABC transport system permease protein